MLAVERRAVVRCRESHRDAVTERLCRVAPALGVGDERADALGRRG